MTTAQIVETSVTFNNNSTSPIQDTFTRTIKLNLYFWNDPWVEAFHNNNNDNDNNNNKIAN